MYYSEIGKIIEAGLDCDKAKVRSFAQLLAKKMKEDGEKRGSTHILNILERKGLGLTIKDSLAPLPVDQESRMNIVNIDFEPHVDRLILSEPVRLKLQDFIDTIQHKKVMDDMGLDFSRSLLLRRSTSEATFFLSVSRQTVNSSARFRRLHMNTTLKT